MAAGIVRMARHLFAPSATRWFPAASLERIASAITQGEQLHTGEVCFAVESAQPWRTVLAGEQARDRALAAFAQLQVWDTVANNGVLLYLLLAEHRIEIVADRGLDGLVSTEQWRGVCQLMEERLRAGEAEAAVVQGVARVCELLRGHFPRKASNGDANELPDQPRILR